jgi:hypothetical protein
MEREERRECGSWAWVNRSRRIGVRSGPRGAGGWIREESRRGRHASMERDESRERSRSWAWVSRSRRMTGEEGRRRRGRGAGEEVREESRRSRQGGGLLP